MNDDNKPVNTGSKRFEFLRLLELLPRTMWVEDADNVLLFALLKQEEKDKV